MNSLNQLGPLADEVETRADSVIGGDLLENAGLELIGVKLGNARKIVGNR